MYTYTQTQTHTHTLTLNAGDTVKDNKNKTKQTKMCDTLLSAARLVTTMGWKRANQAIILKTKDLRNKHKNFILKWKAKMCKKINPRHNP